MTQENYQVSPNEIWQQFADATLVKLGPVVAEYLYGYVLALTPVRAAEVAQAVYDRLKVEEEVFGNLSLGNLGLSAQITSFIDRKIRGGTLSPASSYARWTADLTVLDWPYLRCVEVEVARAEIANTLLTGIAIEEPKVTGPARRVRRPRRRAAQTYLAHLIRTVVPEIKVVFEGDNLTSDDHEQIERVAAQGLLRAAAYSSAEQHFFLLAQRLWRDTDRADCRSGLSWIFRSTSHAGTILRNVFSDDVTLRFQCLYGEAAIRSGWSHRVAAELAQRNLIFNDFREETDQ